MKIIRIVTNPAQIWRILTKITAPEDEPQDLLEWDICQRVPGTVDGFPEEYDQFLTSGLDPPDCRFDDNIDLPHCEDYFIQYD